MSPRLWIAACGAACALAACAEVEPAASRDGVPRGILPTDAAPDARSGYVGALFSGDRYALELVDAGGRTYVLPFGPGGKDVPEDRVALVAVPPGDYRVATWFTPSTRRTMRHPVLSTPFPVDAGQVVLLGWFLGRTERSRDFTGTTYRYTFRPMGVTSDEAVRMLRATYTGLGAASVACLLCSPAKNAAAEAAAPVSAPRGEFTRGVVLHFRRPSGNYSGWGLHVWEEIEGAPIRLLPGVTWRTPLAPTGHDDFGIYWELTEQSFRNGRVPFIVHDGDVRDVQRLWSIADAREAWFVDGDTALYTSRDAALAAQPE